jgi:ApaG protein
MGAGGMDFATVHSAIGIREMPSNFRPMPAALTELQGLHVTIDRVVYVPHLEAPADRPYPFVYFITIHNDSPETVTIRGRKWVVTDADEHRIVVEGDGVVGKFPRLKPGENFSYNSYHVIGSRSVAEGAFFGTTESGEAVYTRIPSFVMDVPSAVEEA